MFAGIIAFRCCENIICLEFVVLFLTDSSARMRLSFVACGCLWPAGVVRNLAFRRWDEVIYCEHVVLTRETRSETDFMRRVETRSEGGHRMNGWIC